MLNRKQHLLAAALLMACTSNTFAANDAVLKVTGKIIPGACEAKFFQNGLVDFGDIKTENLKVNEATDIGSKFIAVDVTCSGNTGIAISAVDNKSGTVAYNGSAPPDGTIFGLGLTKGQKKIGGYTMKIDSVASTDGTSSDALMRPTKAGSAAWSKYSGAIKVENSYALSDGKGSTNPGKFKVHGYEFEILGYIAPTKDLDLTDEIILDGQATFQISYI